VAKIYRTHNCDTPLDRVLNVGGFNLSRATEIDPQFLDQEYPFEWAGAYPLKAGTHELVIGHTDDDDYSAGQQNAHEGCNHDHHHHGNENELDVVVMPVKSLDEADIATSRDAAALMFSDWETRVKAGDPITPGATLHRLLLENGHGHFPLKIDEAGHYLVFEGCGEDPLHIHVDGETSNPV